tara:strand:+ start:13760 stop:15298 length:1539 start_codon:yes stop_codon:yes gene_type:complete
MISFLKKNLFVFFLRLGIKKNRYKNFKDLNFKQNDFINYKVVKNYVLKERFVHNTSIQDIHTFNFLFFYQKIGGKKGIDLSKKNIFLWFEKFRFAKNFPWVGDLSSKRLISILYNYDFVCSISSKNEIKLINIILNLHIKRIEFDTKIKKITDFSSYDILALFLIQSIKKNINNVILEKLLEFLNTHIDENSMHRSYNILEHAKFLNNLNEVKNILLFFNVKIPEYLNNQILGMTSLLKSYTHTDFTLPLFNGCNNNHNKEIEKIYSKEQYLKSKSLLNYKNGLAFYSDVSRAVFFDVVQPTSFGFHKSLSAGSLAIEISSNGEKIITNCGGSEIGGRNPSYLKYSAAHSTIIINNTNISEVKEDDIKTKFPKQVMFESKEDKNQIIFKGSHNGYLKNFKKICKRELVVYKKKNLFIGKDTLISSKSTNNKSVFHIRFHIMPEISTNITSNKKNIILKTKQNNIWIFKSSNEINIEKSIYVKNDIAIETSQIVISGITSLLKNNIQWSLEKI